MILKEFDLNKHIESEKAYSEYKSFFLIQKLLADNRHEDLTRATTDKDFRDSLYEEYNIE